MAQEKNYRCSNCGGTMVFDTKTQTLRCENCGAEIVIEDDKSMIKEHLLTRKSVQTIKASAKESKTMECKCCGAKVEVSADSSAVECPYCGTPYVLAEKQEDVVVPDGVLPFKVEKKEVGNLVNQWIGKRWLAPNALKNLYQNDKLQGVYLPYWTFDAKADASYTAEGGKNREEVTKDKDGKEVKRTVTDWYPTAGRVNENFDDILIKGSEKLDAGLLHCVEPFNLKNVASYSADYFSGYEAECFSRDLDAAHKDARREMEEALEDAASADVRKHYDTVRNVKIRARYFGETYKQIFLPVYSTSYHFNGKQYNVLINGESGKISGAYPKSPIKVTAVIAAVILVIVLLFMLLTGGDKEETETAAAIGNTETAVVEMADDTIIDAEWVEFEA